MEEKQRSLEQKNNGRTPTLTKIAKIVLVIGYLIGFAILGMAGLYELISGKEVNLYVIIRIIPITAFTLGLIALFLSIRNNTLRTWSIILLVLSLFGWVLTWFIDYHPEIT